MPCASFAQRQFSIDLTRHWTLLRSCHAPKSPEAALHTTSCMACIMPCAVPHPQVTLGSPKHHIGHGLHHSVSLYLIAFEKKKFFFYPSRHTHLFKFFSFTSLFNIFLLYSIFFSLSSKFFLFLHQPTHPPYHFLHIFTMGKSKTIGKLLHAMLKAINSGQYFSFFYIFPFF